MIVLMIDTSDVVRILRCFHDPSSNELFGMEYNLDSFCYGSRLGVMKARNGNWILPLQ